jgi:hypothetical protein
VKAVLYEPVPAGLLSPGIYPLRPGEVSHHVAYELTTVPIRVAVRWTGGCGNLDESQADAMYELFVDGFQGFTGAQLFGATRMIRQVDGLPVPTTDPRHVRHGITEVPPMIRRTNPDSKILGVVPIEAPPVQMDFNLGTVISRDDDYVTVVHPGVDYALMIQASPDDGVIWEAEYKWCYRFLIELQRANFRSLLVSYNGGQTTEKEIMLHARTGLPVLLIAGSGGKTGHYAGDHAFLDHHPNVQICEPTVKSLRLALELFGALPSTPTADVIPLRRKDSA